MRLICFPNFLFCFLLLPLLSKAQWRLVRDSNVIHIVHPEKKIAASLDLNDFIEGVSFSGHSSMRFGSFRHRQCRRRVYNRLSDTAFLQFGNQLFLTGNLRVGHTKMPFELGLMPPDSSQNPFLLTAKITGTGHQIDGLAIKLKIEATHFWGFGAQFSNEDFAGQSIRTFTEENGIGRGDQPLSRLTRVFGIAGQASSSYFPMPFFFTEKGISYSTVPSDVAFDFSRPGLVRLETYANNATDKCLVNLFIDDAAKTTQPHPHFLPDWSFGTIMGLQGGQARVEQLLDQAIAAGNPATAVWIQDWTGRRQVKFGARLWWTWTADTLLYPDLRQWISHMNRKGVNVLGYINPFLVEESPWFAEALQRGYLVQNARHEPYRIKAGGFDAYLIDLGSEEACQWYKEIIKSQLIDNGFSGWMADFGEWLPTDARLANGFTGKDFHNFYPVAWARINREAARERGVDDSLMIFHRSGNAGAQPYIKMLWAGDQTTDFGRNDGLPSAIRAILTASASGIAYIHSDIGGYTNVNFGRIKIIRDRETLYRWAEFAAFTPFFRTHEGLKPDKNIQVYSDAEAIAFFSRMGQLHYALKPYFKQIANSGEHLIRPLYLLPDFKDFRHEFLLGSDLLVAPVTSKGQQTITVKFPEGTWRSAWEPNGTVYRNKGTEQFCVPFGKPAVFIRQGTTNTEMLHSVFGPFRQ